MATPRIGTRGETARITARDRPRRLAGYFLAASVTLAACVTTNRPLPQFDPASQPRTETKVQVFDPAGKAESDSVVVGKRPRLVGELKANPWSDKHGEPDEQGQPDKQGGQDESATDRQKGLGQKKKSGQEQAEELGDEDLYLRFGSRIVIHADRRISKPYYVNATTSKVLYGLLGVDEKAVLQGMPFKFGADPKQPDKPMTVLDTLLDGFQLMIQVIPNFDTVEVAATLVPAPKKPLVVGFKPAQQGTNSLVLVTGTADGLDAFEQAMDLFYRSVPQVLIEAKVIEIAYGETLDIGVVPVDDNTPTIRSVGSGGFVKELTSFFPGAAPKDSSQGLLTIGGIHDNIELNAVLELLMTTTKADIVSNPRIAVRNGGVAVIDTTTRIPYPKARILGNNTEASIDFLNTGINLSIYPVVAPGDVVILQIHASVETVTGFAETDPIPTPEVSTRRAVTQVHVPSGKTIVIGGLVTKTSFENESKIPLLGDIPILGYLFRSSFTQTENREVMFTVRPRITYGHEGNAEDFGVDG
jgi:type II secretory pathway component GspD/PulD (secretin)